MWDHGVRFGFVRAVPVGSVRGQRFGSRDGSRFGSRVSPGDRGGTMIDECGLCDARRDDVREYDAGSGLYLCRPCRVTEDEYREIARVRGVFGFDTDGIGGE